MFTQKCLQKFLRKNLTTLIQKRHILMRTAVLYIYIYIYIYMYININRHILMKAAILCNGNNWTINKITLYKYIYIYMYICIYSSYDETIQRKQSAQYRKRRAITVKVTLTSARCDTEFHIRR